MYLPLANSYRLKHALFYIICFCVLLVALIYLGDRGWLQYLRLANEQQWENPVQFVANSSNDKLKVDFILSKEGDTAPYRTLQLWVKVKPAVSHPMSATEISLWSKGGMRLLSINDCCRAFFRPISMSVSNLLTKKV
jgi:hypothetical protein